MLSSFFLCWRNIPIRIASVTLFLLGFTYAATLPYQSIIGLHQLGMSRQSYSVLTIAVGLANVTVSLVLGVLSDAVRDRKFMILVISMTGIVGYGLFFLSPSISLFVFCLLLPLPFANALYSLLFASVRVATAELPARDAASVNTVVRAVYACSWIVVPGIVGLYLARRSDMTLSWGFAASGYVACFCLYALFAPHSRSTWHAPPREGPLAAFRLMASPAIVLRVLALSAVVSAHTLNGIVTPLIVVTRLGGSSADVGFIAGGVAALEVPFMLIWGAAQHRFSSSRVLVAGSVLFGLYLLGLSLIAHLWQIYALMALNAAGAAAILSIPLSLLQNLVVDRPGMGTSLLSLVFFVSNSLAATAFGLSGLIMPYGGTILIGAALIIAGCSALLILEKVQVRSDREVSPDIETAR